MGWGINIKKVIFPFKRKITIKNLFLSRVTKDELEDKLRDTNNTLEYIKKRLVSIASNTSESITQEDGTKISVIDYSLTEIQSLLNDYEESVIESFLIEQCLNSPEDVEQE